MKDGKRFLVLEIISYIDNNPSPFCNLGYTHPRTRKYKRTRYKVKDKRLIDYDTRAKINRGISGLTNNRNPIMIKNEPPIHKQKDPIIIEEIPAEILMDGVKQTGGGIGVNQKNGKKAREIKVTLNDESRNGIFQAAEFLPFTDINNMDVGLGLKSFFEAVNAMKELRPEWDITYVINNVPEDLVLAVCGNNLRKYALIKVKNIDFEAYVMEFDLSDELSISTIMFSPANLEFVDQLFDKYITSQKHWAREDLEDTEDYRVDWVKHMSLKPEIRGKSIVQKLEKLII